MNETVLEIRKKRAENVKKRTHFRSGLVSDCQVSIFEICVDFDKDTLNNYLVRMLMRNVDVKIF